METVLPPTPPPTPRRKHVQSTPSRLVDVRPDHPKVEFQEGEETFDPDDARAMSPRRNCEDLEKMGKDTRDELLR